jgi:hypothetical protein
VAKPIRPRTLRRNRWWKAGDDHFLMAASQEITEAVSPHRVSWHRPTFPAASQLPDRDEGFDHRMHVLTSISEFIHRFNSRRMPGLASLV